MSRSRVSISTVAMYLTHNDKAHVKVTVDWRHLLVEKDHQHQLNVLSFVCEVADYIQHSQKDPRVSAKMDRESHRLH